MPSELNTIQNILNEQQGDQLAALKAAYDSTPRGEKVASGPYKGKMRGELRALISALESGNTQQAQNIQAISSSGIGGGLTRDAAGNVTVDQEKAQAQSDKYMGDVAAQQGGEYNPETGQIEFGQSIPLISTGNFFSVGKEGDMNTNWGNIGMTALQAGMMAIPGGAALGAAARGAGGALRTAQALRAGSQINKAARIASNARAAAAAGASRGLVQGMQQTARATMQQGTSRLATATGGRAMTARQLAGETMRNAASGAMRGAQAGTAPLRAAATGLNTAVRAGGSVVGGGLRGAGSVIGGGLRGAGSVIGRGGAAAARGAGAQTARRGIVSTVARAPLTVARGGARLAGAAATPAALWYTMDPEGFKSTVGGAVDRVRGAFSTPEDRPTTPSGAETTTPTGEPTTQPSTATPEKKEEDKGSGIGGVVKGALAGAAGLGALAAGKKLIGQAKRNRVYQSGFGS